MACYRTITADGLIERVEASMATRPKEARYSPFAIAPDPTEPAAYALVVGAGFSAGVVPLVRELMHETIGGYYFPTQDAEGAYEVSRSRLRKDAAGFWRQFNEAAAASETAGVKVRRDGLPEDPGAAYVTLFTYEGTNVLFQLKEQREREARKPSYVERLYAARHGTPSGPHERHDDGERFLRGFLRYVMDPEAEHGYGSAGRSELNTANIYLAALLEAQQCGVGWSTHAFARAVFTTNFDTLLQNALQMVNLLYKLTDRPEVGIDDSEFQDEETSIHLVYVHGSILRHNPASSTAELDELAKQNVGVFRRYLSSRDVITIGYSGWSDGLMAALTTGDPGDNTLYWCDVRPRPHDHVADLLAKREDRAAYVQLGDGGAGALMRGLYEALVSREFQRDPLERFRQWHTLTFGR